VSDRLDEVPLGLAVVEGGRLVRVTERFARVVRSKAASLEGIPLDVLLAPEDAAALAEPPPAADDDAGDTVRWQPVAGIAPDGAPWIGELARPAGPGTDGVVLLASAGPPLQIGTQMEPTVPVHGCAWEGLGVDRIVSHDIRGGLRGVNSFLTLLGREIGGELSGQQLEFFETAASAAARTDVMAERLVHLLRLSTRTFQLAPLSLGDLVDDAVRASLGAFDGPPPTMAVGELPVVWGNRPALLECIAELITNARKFADGPVSINLGVARTIGPWVYLAVVDDGPGVPAEFAEDAFMPFRLLQPKGRYPGVGMGLTVVREAARAHGGRCWIVPSDERGTAVGLRLVRADEPA
jgi:hypothetical protein